jgi:hypothetical protein
MELVEIIDTYVFLLFMDMADLEPDVFFCQWPWRIGNDVFEALLEQSVWA